MNGRKKKRETSGTGRGRRGLAIFLTLALILVPTAVPFQAQAAEIKPAVTLKGEQTGDQMLVTLSLSNAVFNVLDVNLSYDESVMTLSQSANNVEIQGTVTGRSQLGGNKSPFVFLEKFQSSGGWMENSTFYGSSLGEGKARLMLSVSPLSEDAKTEENENGGKFINAGEKTDILQISFKVKNGAAMGAETLRIEPLSNGTGLIVCGMNPSGGTIGYRDPRYATVELPGTGAVNQSDGEEYPDQYQGGNPGSGEVDGGGGGSIVDKPGSGGSGDSGSGSGGSESGSGSGSGGSGNSGGSSGSGGNDSSTGSGSGSNGTGDSGGTAGTGGAAGDTNGGTGSGSQGAAGAPTDLSSHWAKKSITALVEQKILSGDPDGRFRPEDSVSRAEFSAVLCKLLNLSEDAKAASEFEDASSHWAAGFIGAVKKAGIAGGTAAGAFSPEDGLTREELVTMIAKALSLVPDAGDELTFTDSGQVSPWAKNALIAAQKAGYIGGYPDGTFRPSAEVSRAEMAVVAEKVLQNLKNTESAGGNQNETD